MADRNVCNRLNATGKREKGIANCDSLFPLSRSYPPAVLTFCLKGFVSPLLLHEEGFECRKVFRHGNALFLPFHKGAQSFWNLRVDV
jgi:hypothetical protein